MLLTQLLAVCVVLAQAQSRVSLEQKEWSRLHGIFYAPPLSPDSGVVALEDKSKAEEFVFPLKKLRDKHYQTEFTLEFGKEKKLYCLSGQEEQPPYIAVPGPLVFFVTPKGEDAPISFTVAQLEKGPQSVNLGGSEYALIYKKGKMSLPNVPLNGELVFKPKEQGLKEHSVRTLQIVQALYQSARRLQETPTTNNAAGSAPLRIAVFSKHAKPEEFWIMIMKDGVDIVNNPVRDFRRTRFDGAKIPVNEDGAGEWDVISDELAGYNIGVGLVKNKKGQIVLYLRTYPLKK